jgi:hypothetical protein
MFERRETSADEWSSKSVLRNATTTVSSVLCGPLMSVLGGGF